MAQHLLDAGYKTTVYSRTASKCQPLVDSGAELVSTPREVGERCDVVFTMVGYPSDVREVLLNDDSGVLAGLASSSSDSKRIVVDMTSSDPMLAEEIAQQAASIGVGALDAPVSGGDVGARNAALSIMIGGDEADVEAVMPLMNCMGKNIKWMGGPGKGQQTKIVNQILIATNMIGCVEAMLFAQRAGLDQSAVIEAVSQGAAGSWSLSNLCPRMVKRDFEPGFYVEHFVKDLGIALDESARMGLKMPGLELASQLYQKLDQMGYGRKGTQGLLLALEEMNQVASEAK